MAGPLPPRIVFFGLPGAGKTALAAAFRGQRVEIVDTDGAADVALVAHPDRLERDETETPVTAADALVVAIDAAAADVEVERTFAGVRRFLDSFETGRTYGRAVAGLPVFLTLTKCDKLREAEVAGRAANLRTQFNEYLADGPDGFGTLEVTVATTGGLPADGNGRFVRDAVGAATEFRTRSLRSGRRVNATVSAAGSLVAALAVGAVAFYSTDSYGPDDPLVAQVHAFQAREGSPAQRLSDGRLPRNRIELRGIRDATGFDRLPQDLQEYVDSRLAEFDAYSTYRVEFQPPRLGPADVRTAAELDRLDAELATVLVPPGEYANAWVETDAVKLRGKWVADAAAVRSAEARLHDWYRGLIRRASGLVLVDPFDPNWKSDGDALLRDAAVPPAKPSDPLPGSAGEPLKYAVPFDFARIDFDKRDWEAARDRLAALRGAAAAVSPGGPFALPEPTGDGAASLALGTARLRALPPQDQLLEWAADRFPDPASTALQQRYRRTRETGIRHARVGVRSMLPPAAAAGNDTPADWRAVAARETDPGLIDWGRLLGRLNALAGQPDVVYGFTDFLRQDTFPVTIRELDIAIPTDLSTQRLTPGNTLTLTRTQTSGAISTHRLKEVGDQVRRDGEIVAKYVPDEWNGQLTLAPGESLTASLPVSSDGVRLVWDSNRTKTFAFESLSRPAALVPAVGPRTPATGVRATIAPPGGTPAVPVLLPDLSAGGK